MSCTLAPELVRALRSVPHLPVVVRETTASVGPLVVPGRTPCLRCLELTRADRDPAWPAMTAQLVGAHATTEACDVVLAHLAAGLTAAWALAWLDDPDAVHPLAGAVADVSVDDVRTRRRGFDAHPLCGCQNEPDLAADARAAPSGAE